MAWNIIQNAAGDFELYDAGVGTTGGAVVPAIVLGRGTTDTDKTFIGLRDSAGGLKYLTITATGAVVAATTRP